MVVGRPRWFSEEEVLDAAAGVFVWSGYEGTFIDDVVKALNLHQGWLYRALGSKRDLCLAVLQHHIEVHVPAAPGTPQVGPRPGCPTRPDFDLLLVAAVERGHCDTDVAALVHRGLKLIEQVLTDSADPPQPEDPRQPALALQLLGARLYERLLVDPDRTSTPDELTTPKQ